MALNRRFEVSIARSLTKARTSGTLICALLVLAACGSDDSNPTSPDPQDPTPRQILIPGTASGGIFDPGPAVGPSGDLWMNYSEVSAHPDEFLLPTVSTRIAKSLDGGLTWADVGAINPAEVIALPAPNDAMPAAWIHEVARLSYDEFAPAGTEWKLMWHRYLTAYNGAKLRLFEHGWIALRTASSPEGPWSDERKLFAGLGYDTSNDVTIGAPEFPLHQLFSDPTDLGAIVLYTEPALLVRPEGIYVAMKSAALNSGKIALLLCSHDFSTVDYLGDFLDDDEATQFGAEFNGFSAPEFVQTSTATYLMVTPTESAAALYRGCLVFRVSDLASATLERSSGLPVLVESVFGGAGSFNGACGYAPELTQSGILYSQHFPGEAPEFRIFDSGKRLP